MSARVFSCLHLVVAVVLACCPSLSAAQAAGKRYALLVGVLEYDHAALRNLKHTEHDVEELARVLQGPDAGFADVVVLTTSRGKKAADRQPTAKNIRDHLRKLTDRVNKRDLLLIALAGHGLQLSVVDPATRKKKEESFFCPADARPRSDGTLDELKKTLIPLGELFKELEESGAGVKFLLVDACRNSPKSDRGRNIDVDNLPRPARGTAALFSCKSGEQAHETDKLGKGHGVFFYHVIQGLKGKARNKKGEVTWARLAEYVTDRVPEDVRTIIGGGAEQTPHELKNLEGKAPVLLGAADSEADRLYRQAVRIFVGQTEEHDYARAFRLFQQAAARGHGAARACAAWMTLKGWGTKQDEAEGKRLLAAALPELKRAAEQDDSFAQARLSVLYAYGIVVEKDTAEAIRLNYRAISLDSAPAMVNMGVMYAIGLGVEKNEKEAVKWYRRAAAKGLPVAMDNLGLLYEEGKGVEKNLEEAALWYRKAAEKGYPPSMNALGVLHFRGTGARKDYVEAARWYRRAALKGDLIAMNNLAAGYLQGKGVEKNEKEALKWVRQAAELGSVAAMSSLGWMYAEGRCGLARDYKEALKWYRLAAEKEDLAAMDSLGLLYARGWGVTQDDKEAVRWFRRAADKEHPPAMGRLGAMYLQGLGVEKDLEAARKWSRKAADKGDPVGAYSLGLMYEEGQGVTKDIKEALAWYRKSAEKGFELARKKLQQLEKPKP